MTQLFRDRHLRRLSFARKKTEEKCLSSDDHFSRLSQSNCRRAIVQFGLRSYALDSSGQLAPQNIQPHISTSARSAHCSDSVGYSPATQTAEVTGPVGSKFS
jgi:L-2-hydroxyglutarate oxidase LhgO